MLPNPRLTSWPPRRHERCYSSRSSPGQASKRGSAAATSWRQGQGTLCSNNRVLTGLWATTMRWWPTLFSAIDGVAESGGAFRQVCGARCTGGPKRVDRPKGWSISLPRRPASREPRPSVAHRPRLMPGPVTPPRSVRAGEPGRSLLNGPVAAKLLPAGWDGMKKAPIPLWDRGPSHSRTPATVPGSTRFPQAPACRPRRPSCPARLRRGRPGPALRMPRSRAGYAQRDQLTGTCSLAARAINVLSSSSTSRLSRIKRSFIL